MRKKIQFLKMFSEIQIQLWFKGMMVERLSRELHERTNQMHPKFSRVGVMDLFASTNRKPISKRTPPKVLKKIETEEELNFLAVNDDGELIAVGTEENTVRLVLVGASYFRGYY